MNTSAKIEALRHQWGRKLIILGHYYQQDNVLRHADVVGDSLELARRAAAEKEAERIVFCGVHFMAESAAVLCASHQAVYMPDIHAGCPMADMASVREVQRAWDSIRALADDWIPVVYVNSAAAVKAFCGEHAGLTCTSSNAARVCQWVFDQGKRVLFIPDEHLGTNTARDLGLSGAMMAVYDPAQKQGGLTADQISRARMLVWKGYCYVHQFAASDLAASRRKYPGAKVIVHPETPAVVAGLADAHGSTSQILKYIEALPAGTDVVVGTEFHFVDRLAREHRSRRLITPLRQSVCRDMALTTEPKLLNLLEQWPEDRIVRIPGILRVNARKALERMLEVK